MGTGGKGSSKRRLGRVVALKARGRPKKTVELDPRVDEYIVLAEAIAELRAVARPIENELKAGTQPVIHGAKATVTVYERTVLDIDKLRAEMGDEFLDRFLKNIREIKIKRNVQG